MSNIIPYFFKRNHTSVLDRLFDEFFKCDIAPVCSSLNPPMDFNESDKSYEIHMEIPGMKKEDLDISLENNILTISGEKKDNLSDSRRKERRYGKFSRSFSIPDAVDKEHINAKFENGVLIVSVPKIPAQQPQKIAIK